MFGIEDPGIWIAYLLGFLCVAFAVWYGVSRWNKEEE
jgi:hypothetical protein